MMANPVGSLLVRIGADTGGLRQGGKRAETTMQGMARQARQTATRLAKVGAAATAAGVALTAALTRRGLESVDAQAKLARSLGGTIDAVRGLQIAASDAGIETSVMDSAVERLNSRIGEARRGTGQAAEAFKRLGIDADEMARMDVDQRIATIADRMSEMGLSADQAADELRQMGIRNTELVNLMQQGGDAIRSARQDVDDYGLSLSAVDAAQVEAANDAMERIGFVMESITNRLAIEFAPILNLIADLFNDAQREADGMESGVRRFVDFGIRGFALAADAAEGFRRVVQVAGMAFATLALKIKRDAIEIANFIVTGPVNALNSLIQQANRIPGISFDEVQMPDIAGRLQSQLAVADRAVQEGMNAMRETMAEPMPSEGIMKMVDDAREASRLAAEESAASEEERQARIIALQRAGAEEQNELSEEEMAKEAERRQRNLDRLRDFLMSEREAEVAAHEERMEWLEEALEQRLMTEQEYRNQKEELEQKHQNELTRIEKAGLSAREKFEQASMKTRVKTVSNELEQMTASVANENRAMFNLNKAAAISNAVMSAWEGYNKSLSAYPWPIAAAMAGAHLASGLSAVSQIRSQSFGSGGGSAPSRSGGSMIQPGTGAGQQQAQPGQQSIVHLHGETFGQKQVRDLLESLNENSRDGGKVLVI